MMYQEDEISFVSAQNCCVGFVDIVDSTRVTSSINNPGKVRKYYEIFLNTMAAICRNFGAKIIKNVGDCLILCYPRTSSTNILLIDDEEDILFTFKEGLASQGYNVEAFVDPTEAFTHFVNVNPSHYKLAILDIRMPGLNGLQLYYRLKAINRNIKILFVSALDAVLELVSILPDVKTTNDIIKKPVALDDFIMAVKNVLDH